MLDDFKLRTAIALCEEGGFTKAAAALGVSQPAVSQNIAELEKETGIRIFERERGRVVPTEAGMIFLRLAREITDGYDAVNTLFARDFAAGQVLSIRFSPAAGEILASRLIEMLGVIRPGLNVVRAGDDDHADLSVTAFLSGKGDDTKTRVDFRVVPDEHPLCPVVREIIRRILAEPGVI